MCCVTSCNFDSGVHFDLTKYKGPICSREDDGHVASLHAAAVEDHGHVPGVSDDCTSEGGGGGKRRSTEETPLKACTSSTNMKTEQLISICSFQMENTQHEHTVSVNNGVKIEWQSSLFRRPVV